MIPTSLLGDGGTLSRLTPSAIILVESVFLFKKMQMCGSVKILFFVVAFWDFYLPPVALTSKTRKANVPETVGFILENVPLPGNSTESVLHVF